LVHAVRPTATRQHAARELVDDQHAAVFADHVLLVALVQRVRLQQLLQDVQRLEVDRLVQVLDLGQSALEQLPLRDLDAVLCERDRAGLLVDRVVLVLLELRDDLVDLDVLVARGAAPATDDERSARFVDQDRVDLIYDRVVQLALHVVVDGELHVVAQVVEAELVVLAVGDVAAIRALLVRFALLADDHAGAEAEEAVQPAHPLRVAAREVVVHGDDVHAFALERVQVASEGRDQRLAFAGLHLGDATAVQVDAADQLDVVVAHAERPQRAFAAGRERLGQDRIERLALLDPLLHLEGLAAQLGVRLLLEIRLEPVDLVDHRPQALHLPFVLRAEDLLEDGVEHEVRKLR
jgi:hypothetical protein